MKEFLTEWLIMHGTGWAQRKWDTAVKVNNAWRADYLDGSFMGHDDGYEASYVTKFKLTPKALKFIGEANET